MLPNRGPWPIFPSQNLQYPQYYPAGFHTAYTSGTSAPPSAPDVSGLASSPVAPSSPHASGPSSSPVTTLLAANAREFVPSGATGPTPVNPSPGFPLPRKSTGIRILNPNTGEAIVFRPPDSANASVQRPTQPENPNAIRIFNPRTGEAVVLPPAPNLAHAAGAASVQQPTHQRPLTKKERKLKAKLEAEAKRKAEVEAMTRRWQDEQEKKAEKEAEEAERLRKAKEERSERQGEARLKNLDEEIRKGEENIRRLVEEIRKGEEELRKQEGKELEEGTFKEREGVKANESVPAGMAASTPVTPSPGLPLPKQSTALEISSLNTGNTVVLPLSDPANAAGPASVQRPTQPEHPLTKKERKKMAKLVAGGKGKNEKADAQARVRLWLEGKKKTMQKEVEDAKRLTIAEEEKEEREEEEVRTLEKELKNLEEEVRKEEAELNRREEERRKAEEELRELEEQHGIQQDKCERARKEHAEAEAETKAEKEQKHELSNLEGLGFEREENVYQANDFSTTPTGRAQARKLGLAFAPSASTSSELHTPLHNHDSSVTRRSPHDHDTQQLHSDGVAEEQENSGETAAEVANHQTLSAISRLSEQMEMLLQEINALRNEVRELRNETKGGDRRARSKSPQRESSVPKLPRTATAINQYFIMKEGELDFCPGDVINVLDAPQDTPRGWMYGEINVNKRGFFPTSYVKLEQ